MGSAGRWIPALIPDMGLADGMASTDKKRCHNVIKNSADIVSSQVLSAPSRSCVTESLWINDVPSLFFGVGIGIVASFNNDFHELVDAGKETES